MNDVIWWTEIKDRHVIVCDKIDELLWSRSEFKANQTFIQECLRLGCTTTKYRGKYAFLRIGHAQEIVSAGFSLAACVAAGWFGWKIRRLRYLPEYRLKDSLLGYHLILETAISLQCLTWFLSGVFHFRDIYVTQVMDYLGAMASILSLGIVSLSRWGKVSRSVWLAKTIFFLGHSVYLLGIEFNFGYNAMVCGLLFALNCGLWVVWYRRLKSPCRVVLKVAGVGLVLASLFQALDFGPILFLVDSHALWHIFGFLFSSILYYFYYLDLTELGLH
ncbi:post-GPI attachment to proteins factor 3 [Nematocida homosporus]|uniref:post-GPI attachment to proteins factor 3 n=1 Tax=Nematocida homosporus TaxID=1912981 RepID=UPI0022201489|nr:post-GPI attachment to proteins factor 3 [Nematocida homosporus]KAI5187766.1 post-GPI attachment to proteins factor 3 [Nematocida homosporus]